MDKEKNWQEDRRWMTDDVRAIINGKQGIQENYMGLMMIEHRLRR